MLKFLNQRHKKKLTKDPNIKDLENKMTEKIGLNVEIKNNKQNKGSLIFHYRDADQLNKIIEIISKYY